MERKDQQQELGPCSYRPGDADVFKYLGQLERASQRSGRAMPRESAITT